MPRRIRILVSSLAALAALSVVGCGGGGTDDPFDPDDPTLEGARLEFVSDQAQFMRYRQPVDLTVRYVRQNGEPIARAPIEFEIVGTSEGSALAAQAADTSAQGEATVRLTSGAADALFGVRVTPPRGDPIEFNISVADRAVGAIVVEMRYSGSQDFTRLRPYLFVDLACDDVDPLDLPSAERAAAPVDDLTDRPRFDSLDPGSDYTVVVVAEVSGTVRAWGCTAEVLVEADKETVVRVTIADIVQPHLFEGIYDLDSALDFGGTLPGSVEATIDILDELTDDNDIDGSAPAPGCDTCGWGQDPGAFLADVVMRWTCGWECLEDETYETCSEVDHELGDLEALYNEDFTDWEGAQSRFFGGCGAYESVGDDLQNLLNDQITSIVPEVVTAFLNATGDLARAINQAHVRSVLTLGEADPDNTAEMSHELLEMVVELRDLEGTRHDFTFDLADVGVGSLRDEARATTVGETLEIPEHTFELSYGELVRYIYLHGLLPLFGYDSTADMLATWIDCEDLAAWLATNVGVLEEATYLSLCSDGLELAGNALEDRLADAIPGTGTLTLEGTAAGANLNSDGLWRNLEDGEWTGTWGEEEDAGNVEGTFTGVRRP